MEGNESLIKDVSAKEFYQALEYAKLNQLSSTRKAESDKESDESINKVAIAVYNIIKSGKVTDNDKKVIEDTDSGKYKSILDIIATVTNNQPASDEVEIWKRFDIITSKESNIFNQDDIVEDWWSDTSIPLDPSSDHDAIIDIVNNNQDKFKELFADKIDKTDLDAMIEELQKNPDKLSELCASILSDSDYEQIINILKKSQGKLGKATESGKSLIDTLSDICKDWTDLEFAEACK
jgi:hypothetical protein